MRMTHVQAVMERTVKGWGGHSTVLGVTERAELSGDAVLQVPGNGAETQPGSTGH